MCSIINSNFSYDLINSWPCWNCWLDRKHCMGQDRGLSDGDIFADSFRTSPAAFVILCHILFAVSYVWGRSDRFATQWVGGICFHAAKSLINFLAKKKIHTVWYSNEPVAHCNIGAVCPGPSIYNEFSTKQRDFFLVAY